MTDRKKTGTTPRGTGKRSRKTEAAGAYVGREEAVGQLLGVLTEEPQPPSKVVIQSIEGPGGIGKTALFEHVLSKVDRAALGMLTMKVSGSPGKQGDAFQMVHALVTSSEAPVALTKPLAQRFTNTEEVRALYSEITTSAKTALQQAVPDVPIDQVMKVLTTSVELGHRLNELAPISKRYVNFEAIEQHLPRIKEVIKTLPPLLEEAPGVLEKLGVTRAASLRNAMRANPLGALAEAFVTDLTNVLVGYESKNLLRPSQAKVSGVDRLLLVLDDYESLAAHLGEFLVGHLVPRLKQCPFETVLVVIGRDQLALTHPGWNQHHQRQLAKPIVLSALSREEMDELVKAHGRTSTEDLDRAWADTMGYPLLVTLWLEEARESGHGEGPSIGMLKRFHDRTTHWLTDEQKRWLDHALFLPQVNVETFEHALGDSDEAHRAMKWFEGDGSVRDAQGRAFRVREYVRSRLADYLQATDPARFRDLEARSRQAVA
jgi:hypothetical protein